MNTCVVAAVAVALAVVATGGSAEPVTYYSPYPYSYPYSYPYVAYQYAYPTAVVVTPQQARYTAVTSGSYHDAPLPGHTVSQVSVNV